MRKRFIVIVLDGFGIGSMEAAGQADTLGSILRDFPDLKLPNLERMGLMNAYGVESASMRFSLQACFGRAALMHFGADTFMGHQEIMGTCPRKPDVQPFQEMVMSVAGHLTRHGHRVEIIESCGLRYLICDDYVTIADNLEADPGTCYNVTAPLDFIPFRLEYEIGRLVREVTTVGRVIVFGGRGNCLNDLRNAEEIREDTYIGIDSAKSKSYRQDYHCIHLGYGIDKTVQVPTILANAGFPCTLIGKVADLVANDRGMSVSCVPAGECLKLTAEALEQMEQGFICTNIQETDLAGHAQSAGAFKRVLEIADKGIGGIAARMKPEDILIVQADHGNDPYNNLSRHTREYVPLLILKQGIRSRCVGTRKTLSDVGATVCDYFHVMRPENGSSFLELLL